MHTVRLTTVWLLGMAAAQLLRGAEIPLYVEPNSQSQVLTKVAAGDPVIRSGAPALNNEAWRWSELTTTLEGYVTGASVSDQGAVEPGSLVRTSPFTASPVIVRVEAGDAVEIVGRSGTWHEVRTTKPVTVYFRASDVAAAAASGTAVAAVEPEPVDAVAATPAADDAAPTAARPAVESAALAAGASGIMVAEADAETLRPPPEPAPKPGTEMRTLSGTLVRDRGSRSGPRYTLALREGDALLAYVDLSRLFIRDINPLLGTRVVISGEVNSISIGGTELVIHARTLRPSR